MTGTKYTTLDVRDTITRIAVHLNRAQLAVLIRELESKLEEM